MVNLGLWDFNAGVVLDLKGLVFLIGVCLIRGRIIKYCDYYIVGEVNLLRFIIILRLFVGRMCILVIRPNLVSLILG